MTEASASGFTPVHHRWIEVKGIRIFYREAGPPEAPVLLLPHGYPCSSFQFRNLMAGLGDRWRTLAPDLPGFGLSGTPDPAHFGYDFDAFAEILDLFATRLGIDRYALWLHDYGSQFGLRHAMARPERIVGLILQNGDIYADTLGPRYAPIQAYWANPTKEKRAELEAAVSEEGFRSEFTDGLSDEIADRVPPEMWKLHWPLMDTPVRKQLMVGLMEKLQENLAWFPRYQSYLREYQPETLILWGPKDGYMPEAAGRAYLRDLPDAEFHLFEDGSHWLLETHLREVLPRVRDFLSRIQPPDRFAVP